ncbi:MAG TPA: 6-carboxytetrahydropterin synthase [Acidimicrobiales bacterium]|nr:6-carboxytetrahydropterin synthase [Acidimicrobiales bacterium]
MTAGNSGLPEEFYVSKQVEFDAGHRVPLHGSKCRSPHGHRYVVRATCTGWPVTERAADEGMVVDFGDLKEWLASEVSQRLDHSFMVYEGDLPMRRALEHGAALDAASEHGAALGAGEQWRVICLPVVPTAENLAKWCFERLEPLVEGHWRGNASLYEVEIWETPTSVARYRPRSR